MIQRGLFAVYKPPGVTSASVGNKIRKILSQEPAAESDSSTSTTNSTPTHSHRGRRRRRLKVGHGGTLDKFAEGVLVIGIGPDCKELGAFQHDTIKTYNVVGQLGKTTDTLDPTGTTVEESPWEHITQTHVCGILEHFRGEISQVPPVYSALRLDGKRFSDRAREATEKGEEFSALPKSRKVHIHSLSLTSFDPPSFSLSVKCGSGTYMRSLVRDIGVELGTVAHVVSLVRTRQGAFTLEHALRESQWTVGDIQHAIDKYSAMAKRK